MPRHLPPLNALRAFEAAGRRESFSGAADELNVTHAAISRHVRGLEKRLGVQLFRNVSRGVELTEPGRRYLAAITPALDAVAEATEALTDRMSGSITVSCEPTVAFKWLVPKLGGFRDLHPDIEVELVSTPKLADLARYECDLALRFCRLGPADLAADVISVSPVYPYGAPHIPVPASPRDLLQHRLLHEDRGMLWRHWFEAAGVPAEALPATATPIATLLAVEGALAGQGLVLTSEEIVAGDVRVGRLRRLSDIGLEYGGYYLIYLPETVRRRPVAAFRNWLIDASAELRRP